MANTIKIKNSGTTSNVPSSLEYGELAINYADGLLFYKNSSDVISQFSSGGGASVTISDTAPSSPSAGDLWYESDTGDFFVYYDSYWVELGADPPSSSFLSDLDGDTLIQVEESNDEDKIRFDTAGSERMIIDNTGKVGIGTTAPDYPLDVNGKVIVGGGDNQTPDAFGNGHLMIAGAGYTGFASLDGTAMWVGHNSGSRSLYLATDETARVTVTGAGNVGVNDTTPTYNLDVNGAEDTASRININSANTANRYLMRFSRNGGLLANGIYGDTGTAYFGTPSDVNLKTGIETISTSDALTALNALRAVDYRYLLDADDVVRKGFIAQEVEEVIPEAVKRVGGGHPTTQLFLDENGDPQYESVDENGDPLVQEEPDILLNWEPITTTLVAAVQELSSTVQTLTARIEALEAG